MAFQQPQRHPVPRHSTLNAPVAALQPVLTPQSATREPFVEQSQEWVLFSQEQSQADETASTQTPRTAGRTQFSEIDSLDTAAVSDRRRHDDDDTDFNDKDTEDLDSLDDGLHEFSEEHASRQAVEESQTVLPQHDGMGMFPGSSAAVQDQHWQHEKHNPRRRRLSARRSSIQRRVDALDQTEDQPRSADEERTQRIEKWRLEQSRAVLDEIERETKRIRKRGRLSDVRASEAALDTAATTSMRVDSAPARSPEHEEPQSESLWEKFKRRVIKEFMGLDDATLSFIFGEALPADGSVEESRSPRVDVLDEANHITDDEYALAKKSDHWEDRLLARIAKELGVLMHQLSEHPGAFSAYLRTQEPLPYAGLVTPKASIRNLRTDTHIQTSPQPPSTPHFAPTLGQQQRPGRPNAQRRTNSAETASLWGIEEEDDAIEPRMAHQSRNNKQQQREREYWEQDLDIKMVFGYLRNRLSSSSPSSSTPQDSQAAPAPDPAAALVSSAASNYAPPPAQSDSLRRAALIRHHHPLVNRNHAAAVASSPARSFHQHRRASSALSAPLSPILGRRDSSLMEDGAAIMSSCASQSTKKSKTKHSGSLGGGSSRNFWDIGAGSVGSSGAAWSAGWGEV